MDFNAAVNEELRHQTAHMYLYLPVFAVSVQLKSREAVYES